MAFQLAQLQIGALLEFASATAGSASVHHNADEAALSQILFIQGSGHVAGIPAVQYLLASWAAVLVHHHGILLCFVEVGRQYHVAVQIHTVLCLEGEETAFAKVDGCQFVLQCLVVLQHLQFLALVVAQ